MLRNFRLIGTVVLVTLSLACSSSPKASQKDTILPLLQKEAESLRADGEKVDPSLQVASTWTVEAVDIREQKGDEANPWAGTVKMKIVSRTKDFDGSVATDEAKKQFEYVWSATLSRWIFKYTPTPAPKPAS